MTVFFFWVCLYFFLAGKFHGEILVLRGWPENSVQLTQIKPKTEEVECGRWKTKLDAKHEILIAW